jgi:DNA-binding CsgD family transcriptional regulator
MAERKLLPWRKMWDYIGELGESPSLRDMLRRAVEKLPRLISCEQAIACLAAVDPAHSTTQVLVEHDGAPENAIHAYCERYFYQDIARLYMDRISPMYQMDWRQAKLADNAFVREFIHGLLHIDLSAGIPIYDADGTGGLNLCFTRVRTGAVSSRDEGIMIALRPHVANLYSLFKRLETLPADHLFAAELAREAELLSKREAEIAGLLCKRLHVHEIATLLMISKRTVETHIQHIYDKLHVNNRVELLHRLTG